MILQGNLNTAGESANWSNHFGNPAEMSTKAEHLRVYSTEMHMNLYQKSIQHSTIHRASAENSIQVHK